MSSSLQGDRGPDSLPQKDLEGLEELRGILRGDQPYLSETVESVLDGAMARKIDGSKNEMAALLAPVMGRAIRQQISEAQGDTVGALHPIIGRTIQRSAPPLASGFCSATSRRESAVSPDRSCFSVIPFPLASRRSLRSTVTRACSSSI